MSTWLWLLLAFITPSLCRQRRWIKRYPFSHSQLRLCWPRLSASCKRDRDIAQVRERLGGLQAVLGQVRNEVPLLPQPRLLTWSRTSPGKPKSHRCCSRRSSGPARLGQPGPTKRHRGHLGVCRDAPVPGQGCGARCQLARLTFPFRGARGSVPSPLPTSPTPRCYRGPAMLSDIGRGRR